MAPRGAWPVVLTPYAADGSVDAGALAAYATWLIDRGAAGLFAVALSGEMFELSLAERVAAVRIVADAAAGRVPVAAAVLGDEVPLADEVAAVTGAGADIAVLVVSAVLSETDPEGRLIEAAETVIAAHPSVTLGLYECPLPHHRLLSLPTLARLAATGRFAFLKETSHDVSVMAERVRVGEPHGLRVFNAGIENYAESLRVGVAGLSGWIVAVAPDPVERIGELIAAGSDAAALDLQARLTDVEQSMGATYPSSAKAIVAARAGIALDTRSRWRPSGVDSDLVADLTARLDAAS